MNDPHLGLIGFVMGAAALMFYLWHHDMYVRNQKELIAWMRIQESLNHKLFGIDDPACAFGDPDEYCAEHHGNLTEVESKLHESR